MSYEPIVPKEGEQAAKGYAPIVPKTAASYEPVSAPSPYFYKKFESGATIGRADVNDASGKPFFAYRNPGDNATTTDKSRVASTFDPTVPKPLTKEEYYNPRTVKDVKAIKNALGGAASDELDHAIALTVGGSNDISNLRPLPAEQNQAAGAYEMYLSGQLKAGKISYLDAQIMAAKNKGLKEPWTPPDIHKDKGGDIWQGIKNAVTSFFKPSSTTTPQVNVTPTPQEKPSSGYTPIVGKAPVKETVRDFKSYDGLLAESTEIESSMKALETEAASVDQSDKESVDAFNAKVKAFNTRAHTFRSAADEYNKSIPTPKEEPSLAFKASQGDGSTISSPGYKKTTDSMQPDKFKGQTISQAGEAPSPWYEKAAKAVKQTAVETTQEYGKRMADFTYSLMGLSGDIKPNGTMAEVPKDKQTFDRITTGISAGLGIVNELFLLITAPMKGGEYVPVVAPVFKGVNTAFTDIAEVMKPSAKLVVDSLPIDPESKAKLQPVADELFGLLATIALGKVAHEVAAPKVAKLTSDIKDIASNAAVSLIKDKIIKTIPAKSTFINPDTIRDYIAGRDITDIEATDLYKTLGRTADQIRKDVKNGVTVEVPEKVIEILKDKPYWAKIKEMFTAEYFKSIPNTQGGFIKNPLADQYPGEKEITTKVLDKLEGRTTVSKQFISDLTNAGEMKQAERDLVRQVLNDYPDGSDVPVKEFAAKVQSELLPLSTIESKDSSAGPRYEQIALPDEIRGNVADYNERIYESPIKTSAGDVHFGGRDVSALDEENPQSYFAHSRIEDLAPSPNHPLAKKIKISDTAEQIDTSAVPKVRRVIEIQSDLFQKGGLDSEIPSLESQGVGYMGTYHELLSEGETNPKLIADKILEKHPLTSSSLPSIDDTLQSATNFPDGGIRASVMREIKDRIKNIGGEALKARQSEIAKLEPYRNTWQNRIISEEVRQAAKDGKNKLQFPTGETAMKIEGLGQNSRWYYTSGSEIAPAQLKVGVEILQNDMDNNRWIITDVLGEGKFKAVPKNSVFPNETGYLSAELGYKPAPNKKDYVYKESDTESFDISGKIDQNNPIFRFYEKEVGRYLASKFAAKRITDDKGVSWYEIDIKPDMAKRPVGAFGELGANAERTQKATEGQRGFVKNPFDSAETPKETYLIDTPGRKALRENIVNVLYGKGAKNKNRRADVIIGLPASGKSTIADKLIDAHGSLLIDADKAKALLPEWNGGKGSTMVHKEGSRLAQRDVMARAIEAGDNVVFPTLGRFADKLEAIFKNLTDKGYKINLHYVDAPLEISRARAEKRFKERGQHIPENILSKQTELDIRNTYYKLKTYDGIQTHQRIQTSDQGGSRESGGRDIRSGPGGQHIPGSGAKGRRVELEAANREYIKVEITAALEAAHDKAIETIKADPTLEELRVELAVLEEADRNDLAKGLIKHTNKKTGELPEVTGKSGSMYAQSGDDIVVKYGIENSGDAPKRIEQIRARQQKIVALRHEIQLQALEVRDKVKAVEDEAVLSRIAEKSDKHISKIMGDEADQAARVKRVLEAEQASSQMLADETQLEDKRKTAIKKAIQEEKRNKGIIGKLKSTFGPIANTDPVTQRIYQEWNAKRLSAKEIANQTEASFVDRGFGGTNDFAEIMEYQAGKKTPWIREFFDAKWTEGKRRGLDTYYRDDYFTQVYKEPVRVIKEKIAEFLRKEAGLSKEDAKAYVEGEKELPEYIAIRLKMTPSFVKTRVFPDYATALRYGLTPKFLTIPEHFAYYVEEMEKVVANNEMIEEFIKEHKFLDHEDAPQSWIEVRVPGAGKRKWYASPDLAKALNKQFQLDADITLLEWAGKITSGVAGLMSDIVLAGGLPYTPVNYFAVGHVIRSLTTGLGALATGDLPLASTELRAARAFVRAFSDTHSIKWMKDRTKYIEMMGRQGINVESRIGAYDELYQGFTATLFDKKNYKDVLKSIMTGTNNALGLLSSKGRKDLFGTDEEHKIAALLEMFTESKGTKLVVEKYNDAMNRKTFKSLIPQMQIEVFKSTYDQAVKSGLSPEEAEAFAGQVVKNEFGTITALGRSKAVQNAINSVIMAPKFRESLINMFAKTIKGSTTQRRNPAYRSNRAFAYGAMISFALYQLINYSLNKEFTWNNENGRKFSIKINLPNGDIAYVEFLPSTFATPRLAVQAGIALATGDIGEAGHQLSGFLSMPLTLTADSLTNKDHFNRPIYKPTDSAFAKFEKASAHIGSGFVHPYSKELYKYFTDKEPLYQALSLLMEIPLKYSNVGKESQSKFFAAQDELSAATAKAQAKFQSTYTKIKDMSLAGDTAQAADAYQALSSSDKDLFNAIKKSEATKARQTSEREMYTMVEKIKKLSDKGDIAGAMRLYELLNDDEKKLYQSVKKKFYPAKGP